MWRLTEDWQVSSFRHLCLPVKGTSELILDSCAYLWKVVGWQRTVSSELFQTAAPTCGSAVGRQRIVTNELRRHRSGHWAGSGQGWCLPASLARWRGWSHSVTGWRRSCGWRWNWDVALSKERWNKVIACFLTQVQVVAGGSTDSGSDHYVTLSLLSRWWFQHLVLLDEVKMVVLCATCLFTVQKYCPGKFL